MYNYSKTLKPPCTLKILRTQWDLIFVSHRVCLQQGQLIQQHAVVLHQHGDGLGSAASTAEAVRALGSWPGAGLWPMLHAPKRPKCYLLHVMDLPYPCTTGGNRKPHHGPQLSLDQLLGLCCHQHGQRILV